MTILSCDQSQTSSSVVNDKSDDSTDKINTIITETPTVKEYVLSELAKPVILKSRFDSICVIQRMNPDFAYYLDDHNMYRWSWGQRYLLEYDPISKKRFIAIMDV
ncbi:hypothetical protein [Reichenbachiella sp.]|uniref:hypothetical protein n=1 Tax=Reichenbachiella sp. TaxID=2184521 RepID=UPI003B59D4A2